MILVVFFVLYMSWNPTLYERGLLMKRFLALIILLILLPRLTIAQEQVLTLGSKGEAVRSLQERLIHLGISAGNADGIYGQKTSSAVTEAQRLLLEAGYPVEITGNADEYTLTLIFDEAAQADLQTLRKGSKGERVKELQTRLIDLKLLEGIADGDYGSKTEAAIRAFQEKANSMGISDLPQDGIATPATTHLLMSDLGQYGYVAPIFFDEALPLSLTRDALYSNASILLDAPTGEVLFSHNADEQLYPASTTKILTLLLALETCDPDQIVTIPAVASDIPSDSSIVPVYPGEKMTMRDLLYGLIIRSGNDAANAIGELVCGSVEAFVERMNERAVELGMNSSHFMNPHGYHHENHYSTARDLATLTRYGLTDPDFCEVVTCTSYLLPATSKRGELLIENVYEIFDPASDMYIEGAAGVKSGYTSNAGFCYVGAAQRDDKTLIAVVLGAPGRTRAWTDLRRLFEYGFAQ